MARRPLIVLLLAILIASTAAYAVRIRLNTLSAAASKTEAVPTTKVLVAANDIAPGGFIRPDRDLRWIAWPNDAVSSSYVVEGQNTTDEFSGAVARRAIRTDEPITTGLLVKSHEGGFMSAVLSPGTRAVSISVNATSGNAGFIFPGDRVDLIVTHQVPVVTSADRNPDNMRVSETFAHDVRVLAIDQKLDNPENEAVLAKTVTLEVSPKQAEMINVASDMGKISLALRSLANGSQQPDEAVKDEEIGITNDKAAGGPEIDPIFLDPMPGEGNHITRDSDVSKAMSGGGRNTVTVFHGNTAEKIEFNQVIP